MTQGIVLYTDGGARPDNPGPAGSGIHGYLYVKEAPKKPAGVPDHVVTTRGYVDKTTVVQKPKEVKEELGVATETPPPPSGKERRTYDRVIEVTPVHYFDAYACFAGKNTNNFAEMKAAAIGMRHALDYDITDLEILSDSKYVCDGMEDWIYGWKAGGWRKQDGSVPSNIDQWIELDEARERLIQRGVSVKFTWVRSHTKAGDAIFHLGNVMADALATIGCLASKHFDEDRVVMNTVAAEGYWKYTVDKHPFISHRRMYFNTMQDYLRPGEYYLGDHGKDDDLLGKRTSDGAYAVVSLATPDPILENLRQYQSEMAENTDQIMFARLENLYRPETHRQLAEHGMLATEQVNKYKLDLRCLDKEPLTRQCTPPKLAMRAVEAISMLAGRLGQYLSGHSSIICTDLTPILYETTSKVDKKGEETVTMKLKPEYNVGYAALAVDANYQATDNVVKAVPVTLTLGIDMLDRNSLKRLEELNPKVTLITWLESANVFRYATIVECGQDKGIWAGVYSNLRVVSEKEAAA
jgi:ribonuclease HI